MSTALFASPARTTSHIDPLVVARVDPVHAGSRRPDTWPATRESRNGGSPPLRKPNRRQLDARSPLAHTRYPLSRPSSCTRLSCAAVTHRVSCQRWAQTGLDSLALSNKHASVALVPGDKLADPFGVLGSFPDTCLLLYAILMRNIIISKALLCTENIKNRN